jgi:hypothetical protein
MERTQQVEPESQPLPISLCETRERSASTEKLIRQWLFRFGVEHKEDVAPRLPLWLETFGWMDTAILEQLFSRALRTCKFFPKVSEILEPMASAEANAVPAAAEQAWERVLEIRRVDWNPDIPAPLDRALARLSGRERQAARAAGVFRDFDSVEALHTWAKKRFVESFIAYGELEQDKFLLPDGELKNSLADLAATKALPESVTFADLHVRGLAYARTINAPVAAPGPAKRMIANAAERKRLPGPRPENSANAREQLEDDDRITPEYFDEARQRLGDVLKPSGANKPERKHYAVIPPSRSLEEQKRILRERGFLPAQQPGAAA